MESAYFLQTTTKGLGREKRDLSMTRGGLWPVLTKHCQRCGNTAGYLVIVVGQEF